MLRNTLFVLVLSGSLPLRCSALRTHHRLRKRAPRNRPSQSISTPRRRRARDAARHRLQGCRAHRRIPARRRPVQEDRGADERAGHRREGVPAGCGRNHGRRRKPEAEPLSSEGGVAALLLARLGVRPRWLSRRPWPSIAVAQTLWRSLGDMRAAASRPLRVRAAPAARLQAIVRGQRAALRITRGPAVRLSGYVDGNRNGVLSADIQAGVDRPIDASETLAAVPRGSSSACCRGCRHGSARAAARQRPDPDRARATW